MCRRLPNLNSASIQNLAGAAGKLDFGAGGERDAAGWFDVFGLAVGGGDDPILRREILQAPNVGVGGMLD